MLPILTQRDWEKIALEFEQKWYFGNCIGAIDGKHCVHQVSLIRLFILILIPITNYIFGGL